MKNVEEYAKDYAKKYAKKYAEDKVNENNKSSIIKLRKRGLKSTK